MSDIQKSPIEQAAKDLEDINHLEQNTHFQRYYVRRVREKADKLKAAILYDRSLSPEKLLEHRQSLWAFEEIAGLLAVDRKACEQVAISFDDQDAD